MKCQFNLDNVNIILLIVIVILLIFYSINNRENFEGHNHPCNNHHPHEHIHNPDITDVCHTHTTATNGATEASQTIAINPVNDINENVSNGTFISPKTQNYNSDIDEPTVNTDPAGMTSPTTLASGEFTN